MLDALGNLIGKGKTKKGGTSLMDAHNARIKCKVFFVKYLDNTPAEKLDLAWICRDDQCEMGKWIHGPAYAEFNKFGAFYTMRAVHAQLHIVAGNIVEKLQMKDHAGAVALYDSKYIEISHRVTQAVSELYKQAND